MNKLKIHWKYAKYVFWHKWYVFLEACKLGIPLRGLLHDLYKLHPIEWNSYANYFNVSKDEQPDWQDDFDYGWNHHQKRTSHHWQYYLLVLDTGKEKVLDMPMKDRKEMLADWNAMSRAKGLPNARDWYLLNRKNMRMHDSTRIWIEKQLDVSPRIY
jgi:hypothetical protein